MQIEKDKLTKEIEKIGEFPKNNQQLRRKEEINTELGVLNNGIRGAREKLKTLKN